MSHQEKVTPLKKKEKKKPQPKHQQQQKSFEWSQLWDLRTEVQNRSTSNVAKDCPDLVGHPLTVVIVVILGLIVLIWGLILVYRCCHTSDWDEKQHILYLISTQMIFVTVFMNLWMAYIPWRLKTSVNLYSIIGVLLLLEYVVFVVCFTGFPKQLTEGDISNIEQRIQTRVMAEMESRLSQETFSD
jgi:hypothetical protein